MGKERGRLARSPAAQVACLSREGASDKRRTTSVSLERFLHTRTYSGDGGISSSIDVFPSKDLQPSGIQVVVRQYCLLSENPIICWITHYMEIPQFRHFEILRYFLFLQQLQVTHACFRRLRKRAFENTSHDLLHTHDLTGGEADPEIPFGVK